MSVHVQLTDDITVLKRTEPEYYITAPLLNGPPISVGFASLASIMNMVINFHAINFQVVDMTTNINFPNNLMPTHPGNEE